MKEFNTLISTMLAEPIELYKLENQAAKKWYDKTYIKVDELELNTIYGVLIDGSISFDFKTPTKIDSLLKSFINNYASKRKNMILNEHGESVYETKESILKTCIKNSERVSFGLCYTTLYGIGIWQILCNSALKEDLTNTISQYLNEIGIPFSNETSEAGWVYRFVINKDIKIHNDILTKIKDGRNNNN